MDAHRVVRCRCSDILQAVGSALPEWFTLTYSKILGTHFYYRLSWTQSHSGDGRIRVKSVMILLEMESMTLWLLAYLLNHLHYCIPPLPSNRVRRICMADIQKTLILHVYAIYFYILVSLSLFTLFPVVLLYQYMLWVIKIYTF